MGYIFDFNDAKAYKEWFDIPENKALAKMQTWLLFDLLKPLPNSSILDIGCGTGENIEAFLEKGLNVTGVDPSSYMLYIVAEKIGNKADLHKCRGEDLPFDDNSFDYSTMVTSLEFADNPEKMIEEVCRVTKDRIFIGILNKYAPKNIRRRVEGFFSDTIYRHIRFFGIPEVKRIISSRLGDVPVKWGTIDEGYYSKSKNSASVLQKNLFGAFAGICVELKPRFRTRPMGLKDLIRQTTGATAPA